MGQDKSNEKVYQGVLINWVAEVWYADKLSPEIIKKITKVSGVNLNSDTSENEMFFGHSRLFEYDQETVEEVDQQAISDDKVDEIKHNLDERRDDPKDDIEHTQIEFIQLKADQQNVEYSINFR